MSDGTLLVTAPAGRIRGSSQGGVAVFRGIPFADPPVGPLRFAAPRRRARFAETFEALSWGATPQLIPLASVTTIPEPSIPGDDVLTLNVFTPTSALGSGTALPTLVWIHGGGYRAGSAASPWYDGRPFARDGVILVSIAYRLGVEGFGWLSDAPTNRGVLDWIAALEWVQENIAAFGGDPTRVTVAGQSAGGGAVLTLMTSPRAEGLFARAWAMSPPLQTVGCDEARATSAMLAEHCGLTPTVADFSRLDPVQLEREYRELLATPPAAGLGMLPLAPIVDGGLIPSPLGEALAARALSIPLLIGSTTDEFTRPQDEPVSQPTAIELLGGWGVPAAAAAEHLALRHHEGARGASSSALVTEVLFRAAVAAVLQAREPSPGGTWAYDFRWCSQKSGLAQHCHDIPFFFELLRAEGVEAVLGTHPPEALASLMHSEVLAFIHGTEPDWRYRDADGPIRVYDETPAISDAGVYRSAAALAGVWRT